MVGAPWRRPATSGSGDSNRVVRRAARDSSRALEETLTAETLWNDAIANLLTGKANAAIVDLTKATELAPGDARLWSDLSGAHLQRGATALDPYEFVLALSTANRAVRCNPGLLAARFNRALALQRLSLRDRAEADWRFVARMEQDRLWVYEAQAHAKSLKRPAVTPDWKRQLAAVEAAVSQGKVGQIPSMVEGLQTNFREYLEETLLGEWAAAEDKRREQEAKQKLAIAKSIADALVVTGGDRMAADVTSSIATMSTLDSIKLRRMADGFVAYFEGLDLVKRGMFLQALARFETAQRLLAEQGNPFAYWAVYRMVRCRYQLADYRQARYQLAALTQDPGSAPYEALRGRSLLLTGLIDGIEGRHSASITAFQAAEAAFRAVQEIPLAAKLGATLATEFDILGQRRVAWSRLYPSLIEPATFGRPESRLALYVTASELTREEGEIEIALWFQEEVLKNLQLIRRPEETVIELCKHSVLLAALGKKAEAAADLAQARISLQQISEPLLRRSIEGDLLLAEGSLAATDSPLQAIAKLDEAIPIFRATSYHYRIGHALYQRALAERALGRNDAVERDLAAAIAELERQRETITGPGDRITYLDRLKETFDTMVAFQLEQRQRADVALRFSEQAKARVLWDWMLTRAGGSVPQNFPQTATQLDLQSLQRSLPEGTAVIEYAVLPDRLVLWVLHRQGELRWRTVLVGAGTLGDLVQRFRRALLEKRSADLESISKQLHDKLIRPVASDIAPGERLVLIPDGALHTLPFSLLRDRQTGRYLIQDHVYTVAPSARVFIASRQRDIDLARRSDRRVLIVAAPDFDPEIDPSLVPLKAGEADAAIAQIFPGSQVLRGGDATREAFLQAAGNFEILHFGGHSVVNTNFPLLSQMLFAKNPNDPARGVLYSGDVLRQSFPRTRLAVLASCSTATGRISRTEGVESLARPFLAAGVPAVIASLWDVDDDVTAMFFSRFYGHLRQTFDPAAALQQTQVESLENESAGMADPRAWGAFELIGGSVPER